MRLGSSSAVFGAGVVVGAIAFAVVDGTTVRTATEGPQTVSAKRQDVADAVDASLVSAIQTSGTTESAPRSPAIIAVPSTPESTSSQAPTRPGIHRGRLVVRSQPAGAAVFLNNTFAGTTPLVVRAAPIGSRAVRLQLDGYATWSRGVSVAAGESTTVAAELEPVKAPD